jgi:phytoene dehydrogenase-like protein
LIVRPRAALDPYAVGIPGVYRCSAATPPGAGAHGMCGYNAAQSALNHVGATPRADTVQRPNERVVVGGW